MKTMLISTIVLAFAGSSLAHDVHSQAPAKPRLAMVPNVPAAVRQGGDTIENAVAIPGIPYTTSGTTEGFNDDYDEVCPFEDSTAPDVVYALTPADDIAVIIDLCGSAYDTKLYVYDAGLGLVACNDDYFQDEFCGLFTSYLINVALTGGETYYIVVDGYNDQYGAYDLAISEYVPCVLTCPAGAYAEGEPALGPGYHDEYNGGCDAENNVFQELSGDAAGELTLCGSSGWYRTDGFDFRDGDWYVMTAGAGPLEIVVDAELETLVFQLAISDCENVQIVDDWSAGPCAEADATLAAEGGETVWLMVTPPSFLPPDSGETGYDYVIRFSGLAMSVATEVETWSGVKALFR